MVVGAGVEVLGITVIGSNLEVIVGAVGLEVVVVVVGLVVGMGVVTAFVCEVVRIGVFVVVNLEFGGVICSCSGIRCV